MALASLRWPRAGAARIVWPQRRWPSSWVEFGVHKFYLGKVAQGVIYLIFFWTGIPALIAWIEAITYLAKNDEAWAREYGGAVQRPEPVAIGCLWALALLPLLAILGLFVLIFLGNQASIILSRTGASV